MSKFWHIFGSFLGIAATVYSPELQHAITVHPQIATGATLAYAVLGNLLNSPIAKEPPQPPVVPKG